MSAQVHATAIVTKLKENGFIAYFAGGWVRDLLLKHPSDDIDIATTASVDEIQAIFTKTIPVGIAFGIVIVVEGGHEFEVATFRKERGYLDGRRPSSVEAATPKEDALRRDFTINGMFYDPTTEEIFDYVDGKEDLKKGVIRAIGNPHERLLEDRLRMMRAIRYATRFGFPIEKETSAAIKSHAHQLLPAVAMERVWQEFKKMSRFAHFDTGLVLLHDHGLLQTIFPSLKEFDSKEIAARTAPIEHFPQEAPTVAELLELFPNQSLDELHELCDYLKLSNDDRAFAEFLHHAKALFELPFEWQDKLEPFEWAEFYAHPSASCVLAIIAARFKESDKADFLKAHAARQNELAKWVTRIHDNTPVLRAADLFEEGIAPGKKMGLLLKEAMRIAVDEDLDDPVKLLAALKKSPLWKEQ